MPRNRKWCLPDLTANADNAYLIFITKYFLYACLNTLPHCKSLDDLKQKLAKENIETLYKYKGQTDELQGISFKIGDYKYKGSEIDRKFSVNILKK